MGLYTAPHDPCPEGRLILDFETALAQGLHARSSPRSTSGSPPSGPAAIADGRRSSTSGAPPAASSRARSRFAENYADEAERLAAAEARPGRAQPSSWRWPRPAAACPAEPPRNFREAVQSFWFTYLLGHLEGAHLGYSPGRLDQLLCPYYEADPTRHASTRPWSSSRSSSSR